MKLHPRVTRSVIELVKRFEGLRRQAARLPDGGWTIGYGHTRSAREGTVVSPQDAEALLYYDLSEVADKVEAWTFTPLNQNQFEALIAFAFNIGLDNFRHSTVLKRLNEGQHLMAAAALELWRKSDFGGEALVIDALVRRRAAEKAHYLTPPEGYRPSPTPVLKPSFDYSVIEAAANARAGRPAAVVDAPMHGDRAFATVEPEIDAAEDRPAAFPARAAATEDVTDTRLHQLHPDKSSENESDGTRSPSPFVFESDDDKPNRDEPFLLKAGGFGDEAEETLTPMAPFDAPPLPFEPAPVVTAFSRVEPPPVRRFDLVSSDPIPRFGEAPAAPLEDAKIATDSTSGAVNSRSLIYTSLGLLGLALFAVALVSMFAGKASPTNLVIGLVGILLITPAGGYFLLRFLNKRDGLLKV